MHNNRPCRTCRWWVPEPNYLDTRDSAQIGKCRRSAPRLVEGKDGRTHSQFPQMREDGFCGQHRLPPEVEEVASHG